MRLKTFVIVLAAAAVLVALTLMHSPSAHSRLAKWMPALHGR